MITDFVGQGRFHPIGNQGFILFFEKLTDDLKVLWEGKDTKNIYDENSCVQITWQLSTLKWTEG